MSIWQEVVKADGIVGLINSFMFVDDWDWAWLEGWCVRIDLVVR